MARPKKDKDKKEVVAVGLAATKKGEVAAQQAVANALLKEYAHIFKPIPNRRENIFKTGIPGLDYILGGGLPRGQMVHIYGAEGSGKSTLAQHLAAACLKEDKKYCYIDPENTLDNTLAQTLGLDISDPLCYTNTIPSAEYILDMVEKFVRSGLYSIFIFDTIAALASAKTIASDNQKDDIGIKARMMSKALEKLNNAAVNYDGIIIFINQLRANIQLGYGVRPFTTPGGRALPFYTNINIYMQKIGPIKDGDQQIGQLVKVRIEKNKIAPPMKEVVLHLVYGQGFRRDMDLILSAKEAGVITLSGSWYSMKGEQLGQGLSGVVEYAKEHPDFLDLLEEKLYGAETQPEVSTSPNTEVAEAAVTE